MSLLLALVTHELQARTLATSVSVWESTHHQGLSPGAAQHWAYLNHFCSNTRMSCLESLWSSQQPFSCSTQFDLQRSTACHPSKYLMCPYIFGVLHTGTFCILILGIPTCPSKAAHLSFTLVRILTCYARWVDPHLWPNIISLLTQQQLFHSHQFSKYTKSFMASQAATYPHLDERIHDFQDRIWIKYMLH